MNNVVLLCSFHSVYNDNLIKRLLENENFSNHHQLVVIYFEDEIKQFRSKKNIDELDSLNKVQRIIFWITFSKWFQSKYHFDKKNDVLGIHYVSHDYFFLISYIKNNFNHLVLSFWGSDLLRQTTKQISFLKPLFDIADNITFETNQMVSIFNSLTNEKYVSKISKIRFGLTELDEIDNTSNDQSNRFCDRYGIDTKREVIVIGYNRIIEQQHLACVESIASSGLNIKLFQLVFPWTYGKEEPGYKDKIKEVLDRAGIKYVFLNDRLSDNEIACLRLSTDIFIQVQTTDSLSASMLETLYACKPVITGKWLPYKDLYEAGIKMVTVNSPEEVGEQIVKLNLNPLSNETLKNNKEMIYKYNSWNSTLQDWVKLYS